MPSPKKRRAGKQSDRIILPLDQFADIIATAVRLLNLRVARLEARLAEFEKRTKPARGNTAAHSRQTKSRGYQP